MSVPKWSEERTQQLVNFVGDEVPVSQATVAEAAVNLNTSTRSISSKLRKMGFDVQPASVNATKAFTDDEESTLSEFVQNNSGQYTYAEIAEVFANGKFKAKQIQGKVLSMELTCCIKPTEKKEAVRTYTEEEEQTVVELVNAGKFVEEIAEALGKKVASVRGKALSLLRSGKIQSIPKQRDVAEKTDPLSQIGDVSGLTVEEIAEQIGKTQRGIKTMLTRRGLKCSDYDGEAKKAKAAAS